MKPTRINVGKRVREIRKNAGLSMKELAAKVGVSFLTIQRIETGKVSPSVALLSEIAYHLNYPLLPWWPKANRCSTSKGANSR